MINTSRPSKEEYARVAVEILPSTSPHVEPVTRLVRGRGARIRGEAPKDSTQHHVRFVDLDALPASPPLHDHDIAISSRPHEAADRAFQVLSPLRIETDLPRAFRNLVRLLSAEEKAKISEETIRILNEIGFALAAIPDREELLQRILEMARQVMCADGGTLYLVGRDRRLHFAAAQNDTVSFPFEAHDLPMDETSLAGWAASRGQVERIDDVYRIPPHAPYRFNAAFDREVGYRTCSMLLVPMRDRDENVIGVLSLINRKRFSGVPLRDPGQILPFSDRDMSVARSIAAQAAVAVENHRLYREIRTLFDGFAHAAVKTIEARDPTTAGHSRRVADMVVALARAIDRSDDPPFQDIRFDETRCRELEYAALLHDFGKVHVREEVLLKPERLHRWELERIEQRFRARADQILVEGQLQGRSPVEIARRLVSLRVSLDRVRKANRPGYESTPHDQASLLSLSAEGPDTDVPLLSATDQRRLRILRGSLDPLERAEAMTHVAQTRRFLELIPWTRDLEQVPELAACHHEFLDGTGYPRGLKGDQIPLGSRLMTICDIYEATTATDRPYRTGWKSKKAIENLRTNAREGKLDPHVVELFIRERIWTQSASTPEAGASAEFPPADPPPDSEEPASAYSSRS